MVSDDKKKRINPERNEDVSELEEYLELDPEEETASEEGDATGDDMALEMDAEATEFEDYPEQLDGADPVLDAEEDVPLEATEDFEDDSDGSGWDENEAYEEQSDYDEELYDFEAPKKKLSVKKMAPALILVGAVGIGAYILQGSGSDQNNVPQSALTTPAGMAQGTDDLWGNPGGDMAAANAGGSGLQELPQPTSNINETPRPPDEAAYFEIVDVQSPAMPEESDASLQAKNGGAEPSDMPGDSGADAMTLDIDAPAPVTAQRDAQMDNMDAPETSDMVFDADLADASDSVSNDAFYAAENNWAEDEDMDMPDLSMTGEQDLAAIEAAPEEVPVMDEVPVMEEAPVITMAATETSPMPAADTLTPLPVDEVEESDPALNNISINPQVESEPAPAPMASYTEETRGTVEQPAYPEPNSATKTVQPDVYYDSGMEVPSGQVATTSNLPRKVDPTQEPASKYVLVKKTASGDDFNARVVAASRALKLERYEAAVELFDQLYRLNPRDPRVLMGRAVSNHKSGRIESALQSYEELLGIDPDNTDALVNMLGILRRQYPEVALRRMMILRDKFPGNPAITAQLGIMEADLGNWQDALRYLGMAASQEPRNAQHMFNMAIIAERAGDAKKAINYYQEALEIDSVYGSSRSIPREQVYDRLSILRQRT